MCMQGDATVLRPTVMCAVPLVMDRIYKGVNSTIKKKGEFTALLMAFCYNYRWEGSTLEMRRYQAQCSWFGVTVRILLGLKVKR